MCQCKMSEQKDFFAESEKNKPKTSGGSKTFLVVIVFCVLAVVGLFAYFGKGSMPGVTGLPQGASVPIKNGNTALVKSGKDITVCVITWGGYVGGEYFNRDFNPSPESEYTKRYGLNVTFKTIDDFANSRAAWKSGECNLLWVTVDAFTAEAESLKKAGFTPRFLFQVDWSRGGDAIIVNSNINNVADLKGKKIALVLGTPSHTFLLRTLSTAGLSISDVKIVETASAPEAAKIFETGNVDAAVTWSPDYEAAVQQVKGAKVLISTKQATHVISDGFFAEEKYYNANKVAIDQIAEGWLLGNAEINTNPEAKKLAANILVKEYKLSYEAAMYSIGLVRLTTIGDNRQFFGIDAGAKVTADKLFTQSASLYRDFGYKELVPSIPMWRDYSDSSGIAALKINGLADAAEGEVFSPKVANVVTAPALTTKGVSVSFESGSYVLSEDAKVLISRSFLADALANQGATIRVEGNTDSVGSAASNISLSEKRAQAVANHLHLLGISKEKLVVVGNGPNKPLCSENSSECMSRNRRTDFSLLK
jgi:NitT/TauT family transport system substrate-binding protein